jgi:predicted ATPase
LNNRRNDGKLKTWFLKERDWMIHLKSIEIPAIDRPEYPFTLDWFRKGQKLELSNPVTIIIGENGSGKSTFMNILANTLGMVRISFDGGMRDRHPELSEIVFKTGFALVKPSGFFFEAEAFITYIGRLAEQKAEERKELDRIEKEYRHKSDYSRTQAKSPHQKSLHEMDGLYEYDLTKRSHGEAYLDFFASRLRPRQIYLLDEPEIPLSSQNQLTLLSMIKQAVKEDCQFIISTHSPILSGYPLAAIFEICGTGFQSKRFEEIESIGLLKQFLNSPEQFTRLL